MIFTLNSCWLVSGPGGSPGRAQTPFYGCGFPSPQRHKDPTGPESTLGFGISKKTDPVSRYHTGTPRTRTSDVLLGLGAQHPTINGSLVFSQCWVRARLQRRRYLEDRRKVVTVQRAVRRWLARRHRAAAIIQEVTRKFLLDRRQKRAQRGIVKAQVRLKLTLPVPLANATIS